MIIPFQVKSSLYLHKNDAYRFVGRFGSFIPVKDENLGSELLRDAGDGKFAAATGSKGYLWAEAEAIKAYSADPMSEVDLSYFDKLANEAIDTINEYVPFEEFVI